MSRFLDQRLVIRVGPRSRYNMCLPSTATDVLRYIAKISIITDTKMKLLPVSSLVRRFVRVDESKLCYLDPQISSLDELYKNTGCERKICGSSCVDIGSRVDGTKRSICFDGVSYRFCVVGTYERDFRSSAETVIDRRRGRKSTTFYQQSKTQHPHHLTVETVEPFASSSKNTAGLDFGYVSFILSHRSTLTIHSSQYRHNNVVVGSVCKANDDAASASSYVPVIVGGRKGITNGKFERRSGIASYKRYVRAATKSRPGVQDAINLMSLHPLFNPCTLSEFEENLYDVHISENIVTTLDSFYNSHKFAHRRALKMSRLEQTRSMYVSLSLSLSLSCYFKYTPHTKQKKKVRERVSDCM